MVCYIVPLVASVLLALGRKSSGSHSVHGMWLNIMMLGGAIFGLIDHLLYGELLLIISTWATDLAIGGAITAGITMCWGLVVLMPRISSSMHSISNRIRM